MSKGGTCMVAVPTGLILVAAGVFVGGARASGIPASKPLVYTGLLQNADGSPLSGAGHNIEIKIWNDASSTTLANMLCDTTSQPLVTDPTGRAVARRRVHKWNRKQHGLLHRGLARRYCSRRQTEQARRCAVRGGGGPRERSLHGQ